MWQSQGTSDLRELRVVPSLLNPNLFSARVKIQEIENREKATPCTRSKDDFYAMTFLSTRVHPSLTAVEEIFGALSEFLLFLQHKGPFFSIPSSFWGRIVVVESSQY